MLERTVGRWRHVVPVIVRVILGFTFFMYGYQKVFERGLEGMTHFFRAQGFPLPGVFAFVASYLDRLGISILRLLSSTRGSRVRRVGDCTR